MKYDFETQEALERLIARQPGGFIGDAIYRDEGERLIVSFTGMTGTCYTGTLPKTDAGLRLVQEKN